MLIDCSIDGHVHTKYCHHARGEMEEYVQAAIGKGLRRIIFLEHLEIGIRYFESTWLSEQEFARYWEEGSALKAKYRSEIDVGLGVEVGYNPERVDALREFLTRYPWDRIALSYHFFALGGSHYNLVSRKAENLEALAAHGIERVIREYFRGLVEAITLLPGQVLCHLDAVLRHHPAVSFLDAHLPESRTLFAAMAARGMALEVNTSGFPLRQEPYPGRTLLSEVLRYGLPLVAGSDAHRPQDVGRYFADLPAFLASCSS